MFKKYKNSNEPLLLGVTKSLSPGEGFRVRPVNKIRNMTLLLYALVMLVVIVQLMSCGGSKSDPTPATPSAQDDVKTKLTANNWNMQSVSVDGVDKSSLYNGLTIKFSGTTFTVTNGGPVWPASGSWSFTADDGTKIKRDDGIEVLVEATATTLKLTLTWTKTTLGSGRVESVKGQNVFTFVKA